MVGNIFFITNILSISFPMISPISFFIAGSVAGTKTNSPIVLWSSFKELTTMEFSLPQALFLEISNTYQSGVEGEEIWFPYS